MKKFWTIIVFLGFSLVGFIPIFSQYPDKKHSKDIDAIKQTGVNFDAAYNRRDAVAFSNYFLKDADFQWHTGELLKDQKQIESTSQMHSSLCQPIIGILLHFSVSDFLDQI